MHTVIANDDLITPVTYGGSKVITRSNYAHLLPFMANLFVPLPPLQVQRLLAHCPSVSQVSPSSPPSPPPSCVLHDRALSGVVALGIFAVESKLKVALSCENGTHCRCCVYVPSHTHTHTHTHMHTHAFSLSQLHGDRVLSYLLLLLQSLPTAKWIQNTLAAAKKGLFERGKERGREGGRERGREGGREGGRERREGGRERGREGGRERGREGGREGGRERGREGGRERGREGGRERGRERGREGEVGKECVME